MTSIIIIKNNDPVVNSKRLAEGLGIQHKNLLETIEKYSGIIESNFGRVAFETEPLLTAGGKQNSKVAYLNEEQSLFIGNLSRNTEEVILFKATLVSEFSRARKAKMPIELSRKDLLLMALKAEEEKEQALLLAQNLNTALDNLLEWVSIIKVSQFNNVSENIFNWRVLKAKSIEMGYAIKKAQSNRYNYQNLYNINVFRACYPQFSYNLRDEKNL